MEPPHGFQHKLFGNGAEVNKKHLCSRCLLILRDPMQVNPCGHRFCKECFQQCVAQRLSCPECIKDGAEDSDQPLEQGFQDNAMKREMAPIRCKCYFGECLWNGTFKDFESGHYNTCSFRPRECPICHQIISKTQARSSQAKEPTSIEPQADHVECLFEEIRRLREIIGINVEGDRGSFIPILERIFQIDRTLQNMRSELSQISSRTVKSGETSTEQRGNRKEERNASGSSDAGKVTVIENVLIVLNREFEALTTQLQKVERLRLVEKNAMETKVTALERQLQIKDVTIAEQDRRISELEQTTFDGTLVWRIPDFSRKREDAISGRATSFYSPAFFTSKAGYKMCVRIYLNGDGMGKGTHVSLFFVVMRGQYDALLTWPFRQKVTLMFLGQDNRNHVTDAFRADPTSNSFRRPTTEMNIASGCPLFMPISQLDSRVNAYVKDNVAFVKVIVAQE